MNAPGVRQALSLVSSQLEAASSLLKFAADDLMDLLGKSDVQLTDEIRLIVQYLRAQSAILDGNAAFCERMGESEDDEGDESGAAAQVTLLR